MKKQNILFIFIGVAVLAFTIFYISGKQTKDLLARQEGCVKAYEKMSAEAPKSNIDDTGIMTVSNHALYSQKQKSCIEALYLSVLLFKDKKNSGAVGHYSIKDIYTGETYFFHTFTSDAENKEIEIMYKSKLIDLKTFGSNDEE
ncbi:MAG: hypothetical protein WC870_01740 [Candidatus Paceibacterota bacterium]